jgi:hypothetical protein
MQWLDDLGKRTRRGVVQGSKHLGGVWDHVGNALDAAASATEVLLPAEQVLGEVCAGEQTLMAVGGNAEVCTTAQSAACGRDRQAWRISPPAACAHGSCIPTCSLDESQDGTSRSGGRRALVRRTEASECLQDGPLEYGAADEGDGMVDNDEAAPMSRGLLGLGLHKHPR